MRSPIYAVQPHTGRRRNPAQHGFTLLELLVVMALTAIIIVLVFRPLIDSFNLTSRAGTQIESQTAAREIMREVSTTLSNAEYIYDNTRPNCKINIWYYDAGGSASYMQVQFGLVDYVAPGHQADQTVNGGGPIDPTTGQPILDPTLPTGKQGYSLPLAPGRVIERMFIGLRDNRSAADTHSIDSFWINDKTQSGMPVDAQGNYHGYANRWSDPHQQGSPNNDNRYTLYKAQFLAYIPDPFAANPAQPNYIPNLSLFHTGTNPSDPTSKTDAKTDQIILNDPNFFYDSGLAGDAATKGDKKWAVPGWQDLVGDGKVYYWENWRAVATSMLQLPKADAIALNRDIKGNITYFDYQNGALVPWTPPVPPRGYPIARALITFSPSYVENEAANPVNIDSSGAEVSYVASSTFTGQHGAWSTPFRVLVYQNNASGDHTTIVPGADPVTHNPGTFYQYYIDPVTMASRIVYSEVPSGMNAPDPSTGTDVGPMIDGNGFFTNLNPWYAFTVDTQRGIINFAFPYWAYMHSASGTHLPQQYNPADINNQIDPTAVTPNYGRRLLALDDIGSVPADQALVGNAPAVSPLNQLYLNPVQNNPITKPQRVRVVPGSEVVYGPDQRPGSHYGWSIQYTRVSANAGAVGPNQYKINYEPIANSTSVADANDPRARTGYIEFDSNPDSAQAVNNPTYDTSTSPPSPTEDPDNNKYRPHSLPLVKAGTSNSGGSAFNGYQPSDPVLVTYNFQMNRPADVVKIDYLTRELMSVNINSRLYDPATTGAQDTILTSQVKTRNLQR